MTDWQFDPTEPTESEAQSIAEWREEDRAESQQVVGAEWEAGTDDEPF